MKDDKEKMVIGYSYEGKPIIKTSSEIASCCCIMCSECGKLLDSQGGPKEILCEDCASRKKVIQKEDVLI
ncbi:hypothetical protein CACET_c22090 [Clostridium aceticum]|uniref:Uncharacterized protein n=1 Tax=Clostridium aceticum TaxID=84022 RepID=A0A0D8I9P5_9CLOT|nr:hypothetical protein [Clostridium aceticum]AKL95655.1 hypothetical protein CACET_c22090 [Clostridium aceticum]KJF26779.1 hypothetical protein TZ02_11225 [Clostridium aceticum]